MKKTIYLLAVAVLSLTACNNDKKLSESNEEHSKEKAEVNRILKSYNSAIESLNIDNTYDLFSEDSEVYESGGDEGNYKHYAEHHLIPELNEFKVFSFHLYKVKTIIDLPYAFSTESYNFTIELLGKDKKINMEGLATSILKKINGQWKIIKYHSSAKNLQTKNGGH